MKNIDLCKKLENEGNGFTIDYFLENDGKKLYMSYDTSDLIDGFKSKNFNTEDYDDINDLDINDFRLGDIVPPVRRWLESRCNERNEKEGFSDEIVRKGYISYERKKYNYEIKISHWMNDLYIISN